MGPVLLLAGVVMLLLGAAGLLSSGGASHTRLRTTRPIVHVGQLAVGAVLLGAGATVLAGS